MAALRLLVTRLRRDWWPALLLALLVGFTALLAGAAPRLFNATADAGLRHQVREASPVERGLQLGRITQLSATRDRPMAAVAEVESEIEASLPASVRSVVSGQSYLARSAGWSVPEGLPIRPRFLTLHLQGELDDRLRMVEGRMPTGEVRHETLVVDDEATLGPAEVPLTVFEVALSTATAELMYVEVGERLEMQPDTDDPLVGQFGGVASRAAVEIVGVFEVLDPDADFWVGDYALDHPTQVRLGLEVVEIHGTALASPDAYAEVVGLGFPLRYAFRYTVDPERFDAGALRQLVVDMRRMEANYPTFATSPDPLRTTLRTSVPDLASAFLAEHRATEAVLMIAAVGPAAVAVIAIAALAALVARRRRPMFALVRGRGASGGQLVASHLAEGLLLAVPAAAVGAWLAVRLVEGRPSPVTDVAAGAVAGVGALLLVAASLPSALRPLAGLERERPLAVSPGPRRLAFEALAVLVAVGGVVLLRQRGLAGSSATGELAGVDPLLAAVPALVGVAVGLVTVRLYPLPVRVAGMVAAGARGLVPALGLRRAERQMGAGHLPLVVLLVTVAIGAFSSTMVATIRRGQEDASWQRVGAPHRIVASDSLPSNLDLRAIPGLRATAEWHVFDASVGIAGGAPARVIALDPAPYRDLVEGTPAEVGLPRPFFQDAGEARPGTTDDPVPAIVSRELVTSSTTPLGVGESFQIGSRSRFATFVVSDILAAWPGVEAGVPFVIVPRELLRAALVDRDLPTTTLLIDAPDDAEAAVREVANRPGVTAGAESRASALASLRARPLVEAVVTGFSVSVALAVAYAALAVGIALVLAAGARARETAQLRTLGLSRSQVVVLTALEHGPPLLVATGVGLALGVAVAWLLLPGLGLGAFTGADADPRLTIDPAWLVGVVAVLLAVVAAGIGLAAWLQRRADPVRVAREGLE